MNIRTAILKAADAIRRRPKMFIFSEIHIPHDCGTPGCALGLIGYFAGAEGLAEIEVPKMLGLKGHWKTETQVFYGRMDNLGIGWRHDAEGCAESLRAYADLYHPALPDSVLAIFNEDDEELETQHWAATQDQDSEWVEGML